MRFFGFNRSLFTSARWFGGFFGLAFALFAMMPVHVTHAKKPRPVITAIAVEGDTAPDSGGALFGFSDACPAFDINFTSFIFDEPQINESGDGAFIGCLDDNTAGIFTSIGGTLHAVVHTNETVSAGTFSEEAFDWDGPAFSTNGTLVFAANDMECDPDCAAIFEKKSSGSLVAIVEDGTSVPGTSGGVFVDFDDLSINSSDEVSFIAEYTDDGFTTIKAGLFTRTDTGTITNILLDGDTLPVPSGAGLFTASSIFGGVAGCIDGPWIADDGSVSFEADCIDSGSAFEGSLFIKPATASIARLVTRTGAGPKGSTISGISVGNAGLNSSGTSPLKLEFTGGKATNALIASLTVGGKPKICAKVAGKAPSTRGFFSDFSQPGISNDGTMVFHSDIIRDSNNSNGIFTCKKGKKTAVVLDSDARPDAGFFGTVEEESIRGKFVTFQDESFPEGVFKAQLP